MTHDEQHRLEMLARTSIDDTACPDSDMLAQYALATLPAPAQLHIAAHVRQCALCQHLISISRPPAPRLGVQVAQLVPLPLMQGVRSAGAAGGRQYVAANLTIKLTIARPASDAWRVTGRALRSDGSAAAACPVLLRSGRHRQQQASDSQGFFTFAELPKGIYTLSVSDGDVEVQIHSLVLETDNDGGF